MGNSVWLSQQWSALFHLSDSTGSAHCCPPSTPRRGFPFKWTGSCRTPASCWVSPKWKCHLNCRENRRLWQAPHFPLREGVSVWTWMLMLTVKPVKRWNNKWLGLDSSAAHEVHCFCMHILNYNISQRWREWHLVYWKRSQWKQIWGDFWPLTDHRSASINITERPIEGVHPTNIPPICFY